MPKTEERTFELVQVVDGLAGGQDRVPQPFC